MGATVTLTHTGGVLAVGLLLSTSTAFAGDRLLAYLGVASGLLVVLVGAGMLRSALRHRAHAHEHHHHEPHGKLGLAGMGLAGGLVPSPSALVVLLGAIGLGRPGFGVLLVLAYGLGMAATLTGVQRKIKLVARLSRRFPAGAATATAGLVVVVGAGLALRAAAGL